MRFFSPFPAQIRLGILEFCGKVVPEDGKAGPEDEEIIPEGGKTAPGGGKKLFQRMWRSLAEPTAPLGQIPVKSGSAEPQTRPRAGITP